MKLNNALLVFLLAMGGCTNTATVSPTMTFLAGLNNYENEMQRLGASLERWPDRQRLAQSIKTTHVVTLGGSKEFNRLVDLDLKRREYLITMQNQSLTPQRTQEMKQELVEINDQLEGLKKVVKGQIARMELRDPGQPQKVETIATIGLLNLAIDSFAVASPATVSAVPSTKVGPFIVSDEGSFSTVQTPDGHIFNCLTTMTPDAGASIKCEPTGGKL
jgi:hypothetical protein